MPFLAWAPNSASHAYAQTLQRSRSQVSGHTPSLGISSANRLPAPAAVDSLGERTNKGMWLCRLLGPRPILWSQPEMLSDFAGRKQKGLRQNKVEEDPTLLHVRGCRPKSCTSGSTFFASGLSMALLLPSVPPPDWPSSKAWGFRIGAGCLACHYLDSPGGSV